MKTFIPTILLTAVSVMTFAQGKVSFGNNSDRYFVLGYWPLPADAPFGGGTASTVSNTVSGCPGAIPMSPLPSGVTLVAALYGGTTAANMTFQKLVVLDSTGWLQPGRMVNQNVILQGIPGGTTAFFQIYVYYNKYATPQAALAGGGYYGTSGLFTATPGASITYPNLFAGGPAGSTWGIGNIVLGGMPPPPAAYVRFTMEPTNQTVVRGSAVTFWAQATSNYPFYYQWYFNGVAIPGATANSYLIASAQPSNAGSYSVTASNAPVWPNYPRASASATASLTVLAPPVITYPPLTQTAEAGSTVVFGVSAEGDPPLRFQWFFNGVQAISPATTNSSRKLTNIQPAQAGSYTVVVTSSFGAVTSPPALLSVIASVPRKLVPGLAITAPSNSLLNVDYRPGADPGQSWASFPTFYFTNAPQFFFDVSDPLPAERIYRAWQTDALAPPPTVELHIVPAISLTGAVGSTLRVDYINQFGPTDAWMPLATNTLPSASQLYFDTSSIGQPPRLWRIVPVP